MTQRDVGQLFRHIKAVITDSHFVYTSGRHGTAYVNKDVIYTHPIEVAHLCYAIAERFAGNNVHVVAAPAIGGTILSSWTAYFLTRITGQEVYGIYAEKECASIPDPENRGRKCFAETGAFVFQRGYKNLVEGRNVLIVEDILTTGGTVKKVVGAVKRARGNVIGIGALCNRGNVRPQDAGNVPRLTALIDVNLDNWEEADCPLCQDGVPINTEIGKGREFLAQQQTKK